MDCSICSSLPVIFRPPRNTICGPCHDGAKCLINFINTLQNNHHPDTNNQSSALGSSCKTLANASKWAIEMKNKEEELKEKVDFLAEFVAAFRHGIHTDIKLNSGSVGSPCIPAHRAVLATRSEIFKNLLEWEEGYKAAPTDTITVPELRHEELESLVEFLYDGELSEEKAEKHVYSLSEAADKYEIPYLQKLCVRYMLRTLDCGRALDVLEIAEVCSLGALKEKALDFIVENMEEIVFSSKFEDFVLKNPHLSLQITRASLMDAKKNRASSC